MTHKIGDLVVVNPMWAKPEHKGRVYRVTQVLKWNLVATPLDGGRSIRANPSAFVAAPADTAAEAATATTEVTFLPMLWMGTVVTVKGPGWKQPEDDLFVVIAYGNDDR